MLDTVTPCWSNIEQLNGSGVAPIGVGDGVGVGIGVDPGGVGVGEGREKGVGVGDPAGGGEDRRICKSQQSEQYHGRLCRT